jgi:hypothetical protein
MTKILDIGNHKTGRTVWSRKFAIMSGMDTPDTQDFDEIQLSAYGFYFSICKLA